MWQRVALLQQRKRMGAARQLSDRELAHNITDCVGNG